MRFSNSRFVTCVLIFGVGFLAGHARGQTTMPSVDASSQDPVYACACGCGVFEVGTSTMLPSGTGGLVYFDYAYQDQNINWNGHGRAPAAFNPDKKIETSFYTPGVQYLFNRSWGIQAEISVDTRFFETTGGATGTISSTPPGPTSVIRESGAFTRASSTTNPPVSTSDSNSPPVTTPTTTPTAMWIAIPNWAPVARICCWAVFSATI